MCRVTDVPKVQVNRSDPKMRSVTSTSLLVGLVALATAPGAAQDWVEEARLSASDRRTDSFFGLSLSADGGRVLVGAPPDDRVGAAYVWTLSEDGPIEVAKLTADELERDNDDAFGWSVSLDGDRALVGAPDDQHASGIGEGAAYVFGRSGDGWTLTSRLVPSDPSTTVLFGWSVSLDGDRALVGAVDGSHGDIQNAGTAYIFEISGGAWIQVAKLAAVDCSEGDGFGFSVALDGDRALIGAPGDDHGAAVNSGSAYLFERFGSIWFEMEKLLPTDPSVRDQFGYSVAQEGDRAVIGANWDNHSGLRVAGSAYVFELASVGVGRVGWAEVARLSASDAAEGDNFGLSVALEGDRIVVGAPTDDHTVGGHTTVDSGSVYVFELSAGRWTEVAKLVAGDAASRAELGLSVGLDGGRAVGGAPYDDSGTGSAYVFARAETDRTPNSVSFLRGDTNADGTRNLSDAVYTLTSLFGGAVSPPCEKSADVNDDGTVNLTDAIHLLSFLFNAGAAPADPFAECGSDPTEDELDCATFGACAGG